tara:strand:- start:406 stop:621 length:216 start_codon:yes stop_codon:yes gene_type:complete
MKYLNLKFNHKELAIIRDALSSDKADLNKLLDRPEKFVKGQEESHKRLINSEIQGLNRLIEYIQSKERLFI